MAIFHISCGNVSRGGGKCAVASSAYMSRENLKDERQNLTFDYSAKKDLVYKEIFAPSNAPEWVKDRGQLWNEVEKAEKRINSRLAKTIDFALPKELTKEENITLIREYVISSFVDKGMVADVAYHDKGDGNPHCHVMLTTREISQEGFTKKNRAWDKKETLEEWRKNLADTINSNLERNFLRGELDHRSYEKQGIDKIPTIHEGYSARNIEKSGGISIRCETNREIGRINEELKGIAKEVENTKKEIEEIKIEPVDNVQEIKNRIEFLKSAVDEAERNAKEKYKKYEEVKQDLSNKNSYEEFIYLNSKYPQYAEDIEKKYKPAVRRIYEKYCSKEQLKTFDDEFKQKCDSKARELDQAKELLLQEKNKKVGMLDFKGKTEQKENILELEKRVGCLTDELAQVKASPLKNLSFKGLLEKLDNSYSEAHKKHLELKEELTIARREERAIYKEKGIEIKKEKELGLSR